MKIFIIFLNIIFLIEIIILPHFLISFLNFIYINTDYNIKNYCSFVFFLFYYYYLFEILFYNLSKYLKTA